MQSKFHVNGICLITQYSIQSNLLNLIYKRVISFKKITSVLILKQYFSQSLLIITKIKRKKLLGVSTTQECRHSQMQIQGAKVKLENARVRSQREVKLEKKSTKRIGSESAK